MIEIKLQKIRGTTKTKVPVQRKSGTTLEYRRTGRKPSRAGTGKIDKLPQNVKTELLELRGVGYSGSEIKGQLETMLELESSETRQKLIDANVITDVGSKLTITPQGITDYASKRGVTPSVTHGPKPAEKVIAQEREQHNVTKKNLEAADNKNVKLEVDMKELEDRVAAYRKDVDDRNKIMNLLRADIRECRAELKSK